MEKQLPNEPSSLNEAPPHVHFGSVFEGYGVLCLFCGKELAP